MRSHARAAVQDEASHAFVTTILFSPSAIAQLARVVDRLMRGRDVALMPAFVLASLADNWLPRVAVVRRDCAIVGIVYGKERTLTGFPTGLVCADERLGRPAVAAREDAEAVITAAFVRGSSCRSRPMSDGWSARGARRSCTPSIRMNPRPLEERRLARARIALLML